MDASSPNPDDESFDPTRRQLCPDGACVGVIGADGRCSVCGRTEAEAADGAAPVPQSQHRVGDPHSGGDDLAPEQRGAPDSGDDDSVGFDPTSRRLCEDGACIGVVGDDGVCRACGRRSQ